MRYLMLTCLLLAGCTAAKHEPQVQLCLMQAVGHNEAGIPVVRVYCEDEK